MPTNIEIPSQFLLHEKEHIELVLTYLLFELVSSVRCLLKQPPDSGLTIRVMIIARIILFYIINYINMYNLININDILITGLGNLTADNL